MKNKRFNQLSQKMRVELEGNEWQERARRQMIWNLLRTLERHCSTEQDTNQCPRMLQGRHDLVKAAMAGVAKGDQLTATRVVVKR